MALRRPWLLGPKLPSNPSAGRSNFGGFLSRVVVGAVDFAARDKSRAERDAVRDPVRGEVRGAKFFAQEQQREMVGSSHGSKSKGGREDSHNRQRAVCLPLIADTTSIVFLPFIFSTKETSAVCIFPFRPL